MDMKLYVFNNCFYLIRQSSTEDEEPLVAIDPSDLKTLFGGGDNLQYHDGLTDSDGKTIIFSKIVRKHNSKKYITINNDN